MAFNESGATLKAAELISQALTSKSISLSGPGGASTPDEAAKRDATYLISLFKQLKVGLQAE